MSHLKRIANIFLVLVLMLGLFLPTTRVDAAGSISLTAMGSAYTQNFFNNVLASSGTSSMVPLGWHFSESGTNANLTYTAGNGSSSTGNTYSFGTSGDRAFGGLRDENLVPTIGAQFKNNTGEPITFLTVSYVGEQWRLGTAGRTDKIEFQFSTNATSLTTGDWTAYSELDFSTPNTTAAVGAVGGNNWRNRTRRTSTITGLNIPDGSTFWIRWTDFDATGADDGLAVDDFSLIPNGAPQGLAIKSVLDENGGNLIPGDTLLYTVVMQNQSDYAANGIQFTDSMPAHTTYVAGSVSAPALSTVVSETPVLDITGINVPAHGQVSLSFRVTVENPLPAGVAQISNQGTVYYDSDGNGTNDATQQTDGDTTLSGNQATIIAVTAGANFSGLSKSVVLQVDADNNGFVSPGDTLRYTVVIPNSGDQDSGAASFVDVLPANTTYAGSLSASSGSATYNAGLNQIEWSGTVPAGTQTTLSFDVSVNSGIITGRVISNQGTLTHAGTPLLTDGNLSEPGQQPTVVTTGGTPQGLAIKSVLDENGGNLTPGDILLYTVVMQNQSGYTANGIEFIDSMPAHTTYVTASVSAPAGSSVVSENPVLDITGINVPAHGQVTLSFRVTVANPLPAGVSQISNQGTVSYDSDGDGTNDSTQQTDGDTTLSGNQATIIAVTAGANFSGLSKSVALQVDADNNGLVSPGDTLRYTVVIPNSGDQDSGAASFVDVLPANTTYADSLSASSGLATYNAGLNQIEWSGTVPAGTQATLSFDVTVNSGIVTGTVISNQGRLTHANISLLTDGNSSEPGQQPTVVKAGGTPQGLAIKSVLDENGGNLTPGDTLLYTVVMQNQSVYPANGIEFIDSIPAHTTYVAGSLSAPAGSSVVSQTPVLDITGINVPAHEQVSLSFRVTVEDPLPAGVAQISNQGTVSYDSNGDGINDSTQQTDGDATLSGNQATIINVVILQTTILSQPEKETYSTGATFNFSGSAGPYSYTFECKLDDGSWTLCTSPKTYSSLSIGSHLFQVRTVDENGTRDLSPATYSWVILPFEANSGSVNTGFAPGIVTLLPLQTVRYSELNDLWLEIPSLGLEMQIFSVPRSGDGSWDVSWLGNDAGWLEGSVLPTLSGNAVLTAHVVDSFGQPGPFNHIYQLRYDNKIIVHAWGTQYIYKVREVLQVEPDDLSIMFKHEQRPWLSLITCRGYDEATGTYKYRVLVRAVLVDGE